MVTVKVDGPDFSGFWRGDENLAIVEESCTMTDFLMGKRSTGAVAGKERKEQKEPKKAVGGVCAFAEETLGLRLDTAQRELLEKKSGRILVNCTRQWGKSTMAAVKAVHRALTEPGILAVVASPGLRQSGEVIRKVKEMAWKAGEKVRGDGHNRLSVVLGNGSRIVGLPGVEGTVRGFSAVSMVIVDEAARVKDDVMGALRPMLAVKDGDLWMMSTPAGRRGFFYEAWAYGGEEWERVTVKASQCERISKAFLEREKRQIPERVFAQEFEGSFEAGVDYAFDPEAVEDMWDEGVEVFQI